MPHPQAAGTILCRNRRTGEPVFINPKAKPTIGDLVAVRHPSGFRVEAYFGQPFIGVIVTANQYAYRVETSNANPDLHTR